MISHAAAAPVDLSSVVVIIPALNEELSLPLVLRDLPSVGRVIVVDNGSTDGTATVARAAGAEVIRESRRGYGAACWAGMEAVTKGGNLPALAVFLDADYSDHPEFLPKLVEPILRDEADFVLGARRAAGRERGAMPPQAVFGNGLACFLMRIMLGHRFTDLGPFRAIRWRSLMDLRMQDRGFGWTIEMQIKGIQAGLATREIAVPYRRRVGQSKISGTVWGSVRAGCKILVTIARYSTRREQTALLESPATSGAGSSAVQA